MSEGPHGPHDVGSVGEEAAKLFGALSDWAGTHGEEAATSPECTWCPVCRTVHAVRHASPEVRAQLTTAAQSLLSAASALLAAAQQPPSSAPASRVEKIDLEDES